MQRDTDVAVRQDVVAHITALDEFDVGAALQALEADEGFELAEPDLECRIKPQIGRAHA